MYVYLPTISFTCNVFNWCLDVRVSRQADLQDLLLQPDGRLEEIHAELQADAWQSYGKCWDNDV